MVGRILCFMFKQWTSHVLDVTVVLRQKNLGTELHRIGFAPKYHAVILPDFICTILFQCVNCVWFVTKHTCINLAPQK
jgi:hypothetical protein